MKKYNYQKLLDNILDVTREMQIKVGFSDDFVSLYYPERAINNLLGEKIEGDLKDKVLNSFCEYSKEKVGDITFSTDDFGRVCFKLAKNAVEFAVSDMSKCAFIKELVTYVSEEKTPSFEGIEKLFKKYSQNAVVKMAEDDEFNCLAYFKDGVPDDFIYCIDVEKDHLHYHRLTPMDFADLYPQINL